MPEPKITPDEAEQIRSGYLPPSAVPKVGPEIRRYFGLDDYPSETVVRDTDGTILHGPSLMCGCPLDSGCDRWH